MQYLHDMSQLFVTNILKSISLPPGEIDNALAVGHVLSHRHIVLGIVTISTAGDSVA